MARLPERAKDRIRTMDAGDLQACIYGEIQKLIERGQPKNIAFQYFLPPIPFGPELASFMDIGAKVSRTADGELEEGGFSFTGNQYMRAAVNLARLVDFVPNVPNGEFAEAGDLNALISSGQSISRIYKAIIENAKVPNSELSEKEQALRAKLENLLFFPPAKDEEPAEGGGAAPGPGADTGGDLGDLDDLDLDLDLSATDEPFDLDAAIAEDGTTGVTANPDEYRRRKKPYLIYEALAAFVRQKEVAVLDKLATITGNTPGGNERITMLKDDLKRARRRWETQGNKSKIEAIEAKIARLDAKGMASHVQALVERMEGQRFNAFAFEMVDADNPDGQIVGTVQEEAYFTALRPNNVLRSGSMLQIKLESTSADSWTKHEKMSASASARYGFWAKGSASVDKSRDQSIMEEDDFLVSFDIVQAVIDRDWLDLAFLHSRAYSTVDPVTKQPLLPMDDETLLSDGKRPPGGLMPLIPQTIYFARNLKVRSRAFAKMSDEERKSVRASLKAGGGLFGWGARGAYSSDTQETDTSEAESKGELTANGLFIIAMASTYMPLAPNPNFERTPPENWI